MRIAALDALAACVGPADADTVLEPVIPRLDDSGSNRELVAAEKALMALGPAAAGALLTMLREDDLARRLAALHALMFAVDATPVMDELAEMLSSPELDGKLREDAALILLETVKQPSDEIAQAFDAALSDSSWDDRWTIIAGTHVLGARAVGFLTEALSVQDEDVVLTALLELERLGPDAQGCEAEVVGLLADGTLMERIGAARVLGEIGPEAKMTLPHLLVAIREDHPDVALAASSAFHGYGESAAPFTKGLVEMFDDVREGNEPYLDHNVFAIEVLGKMGPDAEKAIPRLTEIARMNGWPRERLGALRSLEAIGIPEKKLVELLIEALASLGPDAAQAAPLVLHELDGPGHSKDVDRTLVCMGPAAISHVVDVMIEQDWSNAVRFDAVLSAILAGQTCTPDP